MNIAKVGLSGLFTKIAKSGVGQKFYKKLADPTKQLKYSTALASADTVVSTATYMCATQAQSDIDDVSKEAMQIQHVGSCLLSLGVCAPMHKRVGKVVEEATKHIDPKIIDPHKVKAGLIIGGPLVVVTLVNRLLLPAVLTPVSTVIRDRLQNHSLHKHKLDVSA